MFLSIVYKSAIENNHEEAAQLWMKVEWTSNGGWKGGGVNYSANRTNNLCVSEMGRII